MTNAQTFHLYGRKSYDQPLEHVGDLSLETSDTLQAAAQQTATGQPWVELIAFPARAVIRVIPQEED